MKMKSFLTTAIVLFSVGAFGQGFTRAWSDFGNPYDSTSTNAVIPKLSTNNFVVINVPRSEQVSLLLGFRWVATPGAGDSTSATFQLFRGISPTEFESNVWQSVTITPSGTTPVSVGTNFTLGAIPALRGRWVNVSTNGVGTNTLVKFSYKN